MNQTEDQINKICVYKCNEYCHRSIKSWLEKNAIENVFNNT